MVDDALPRYLLITGPDDEKFCRRVSALLDRGYQLHGSPALAYDGDRVIAAQALVRMIALPFDTRPPGESAEGGEPGDTAPPAREDSVA